MPEGDTLFRIAATLRPALEGRRVVALSLPRQIIDTRPVSGKRVERVEARGKNLLVFFEGGLVLHTHLQMNGAWHLYRPGQALRRASSRIVASVEVEGGARAICFGAPVVRLVRTKDALGQRAIAGLGPDLLDAQVDLDEALRRMRARPGRALGVTVMDQSTVAGIGNVFKSEVLFACRLDPFAPVSAFTDEELRHVLDTAMTMLRRNVEPAAWSGTARTSPMSAYRYGRVTRTGPDAARHPLAVYKRAGAPCLDCGGILQMRRQGSALRSTYWCPRCQPSRVAGS